MILGKKLVVILPAYNASKTLRKTYNEIPFNIVDDVVLVDDKSTDNTAELALEIGIEHVISHKQNLGYGGNQKSCYNKALELRTKYEIAPFLCISSECMDIIMVFFNFILYYLDRLCQKENIDRCIFPQPIEAILFGFNCHCYMV